VFRYNSLRQPVSLDIGSDKYKFHNYIKFRGIYYPKTVVRTHYLYDNGKQIIDDVTKYEVLSIDNKPLSKMRFDTERPPKGIQVQDLRPEYTKDTGRGLNYTYRNTKRTVTETSAMLAKSRQ
jgi:hypothetical protein